jgi:hypothetical protein
MATKKPLFDKIVDGLTGFYDKIPGQILNPLLDLLKKPCELENLESPSSSKSKSKTKTKSKAKPQTPSN